LQQVQTKLAHADLAHSEALAAERWHSPRRSSHVRRWSSVWPRWRPHSRPRRTAQRNRPIRASPPS
jgi:hypothetical protein